MKKLENLMETIIETVIESIEKKPWHMFLNNVFAFSSSLINLKEIGEELEQVKNNPQALEELEKKAVEKFGAKYSTQLVGKIFPLVFGAVVFNASASIEIAKTVKEFQSQPKQW